MLKIETLDDARMVISDLTETCQELSRENAKLKALMRRAIPTVESRLTDYEDEFKAACK